MAEAFLTVLFEKLFERLNSPEFANFFQGKKSICEQLRELNLKLKTASLLVNDAEERQLKEPDVKDWLDDLKHVIYRTQDLVDHIDYQLLSNSLGHESGTTDTTTVLMKMKFFFSSLTEFEKTSSICILYNLQTLLLSCCRSLRRLPKDMGRLINLRHLDTIGSPLEEMPPQMGNLKKLQMLPEFVLGKGHDNASTIRELGELQQLSGELYIFGLLLAG